MSVTYEPRPVTDLQLAFPASVRDLMPDDIPEDFRRDRGDARPWIRFQREWFFKGLRGVQMTARPGVDKSMALRHLAAIQGSFEPSHEDKEAAVAYLASLWLEPVTLPEPCGCTPPHRECDKHDLQADDAFKRSQDRSAD